MIRPNICLPALLILLVSATASAQLANSAWPKYHGAAAATGQGKGFGATNIVKWAFDQQGFDVAIGPDGTLYYGGSAAVYALDPQTGSIIWTFTQSGSVCPTVGEDGTVYVSSNGGAYALNGTTGQVIWYFAGATESSGMSPAVIDKNNTVYFTGNFNYVYALDGKTGTLKWSFNNGVAYVNSAGLCPAISPSGTVYAPVGENLYALSPEDGSVLWSFSVQNQGFDPAWPPSIGPDGTVYFGSYDGVYALNGDTGAVNWFFPTGTIAEACPAVGANGLVYFGGEQTDFYAVNAVSGAVVWSFPTGGQTQSAVIGADGTVYVGSSANVLYALNGATGALVWSYSSSSDVFDPAIGADGTLYVACDQQLLAFAAGLVIGSLTLNPASVVGGFPSTGTVSLTEPAPAGGALVALSSSSGAAVVPLSVVVPAGQSSASFTVNTPVVVAQFKPTISGTLNGITQSATLTVGPLTLVSLSVSPTTFAGGAKVTGTVTLNGPAGSKGFVVSLGTNSEYATVPGSVTVAPGKTSATFAVTSPSVSLERFATISASLNGESKQTVQISILPPQFVSLTFTPSQVTGGATMTGVVTMNGIAPTGGLTADFSNTNGAAAIPRSAKIAAGASSVTFSVPTSVVTKETVGVVTANVGTTYHAVTVIVNPTVLLSIALNPSAVVGGASATGTVTLSGPAPKGGLVVKLSSNAKAVTVPASVTVASGKSSATFTAKSTAVAAVTHATLTGTLNGSSQTASLTVNPPALSAVSLSPAKVAGGKSSTGTVTFTGAAPAGGLVVSLSSSQSSATVPKTVTVPAGKTSATFIVRTAKVANSTSATISASQGGATKMALLSIT